MNNQKFWFLVIFISSGLQFVFENYKLNRSITVAGVSNGGYLGFAISSSNPIRYYVTNSVKNKIYVFDEIVDIWNIQFQRVNLKYSIATCQFEIFNFNVSI